MSETIHPPLHDTDSDTELVPTLHEIALGTETISVHRIGEICVLPTNRAYDGQSIRTITNALARNQATGIVLDFMLDDVQTAEPYLVDDELIGFSYPGENVLNIDHHAPDPPMRRAISTTPLVIALIRSGQLAPEFLAHIHHFDADSILSAAILTGLIPPEDRFAEAAIAADHTGSEDYIADTLTGIEKMADLAFSIKVAQLLAENKPLPKMAEVARANRANLRQETIAWALSGELKAGPNGIYFAETNLPIVRTEFLTGIPEFAKVQAFVVSYIDHKVGRAIKVRLGLAGMAAGLQLNDPQLRLPNFGGRWNAGGTARQGETTTPVSEYVQLLNEFWQQLPA